MKKSNILRSILALLLMWCATPTLLAQDGIPFDMSYYRDQVGTEFLIYLTGDNENQCWGGEDNIYTDDSALGTAAVHAGLLKVKETKLIKVKMLAGRDNYPSITRNGITSEEMESFDGSYQLSAAQPGEIGNAPVAMDDFKGKYDIIFVFRVKGDKEGPIWGGGKDLVYTTDSYVATAAVHAGVVKAGQTGIVKIRILPGRKSYPAVTRNGLTSHDFEEWEGSYQIIKEDDPKK